MGYIYQYLSEKNNDFLLQNNYSKGEVLDGIKQIIENSGYSELESMI